MQNMPKASINKENLNSLSARSSKKGSSDLRLFAGAAGCITVFSYIVVGLTTVDKSILKPNAGYIERIIDAVNGSEGFHKGKEKETHPATKMSDFDTYR